MNPYSQYEGRCVEALVIGDWCAVRRRGPVHVVNHDTLLIGGEVVPTWALLKFQPGASQNSSAYHDPDPALFLSGIV